MNIQEFLFFLAIAAMPVAIVLAVVLPQRIRMERRARALMKEHPDAEKTSMYIAFQSGWSGGKRKEMDVKIADMSTIGWTLLRATEASPLKTIRSWGGGLTMHFIRSQIPRISNSQSTVQTSISLITTPKQKALL